MASKIFYIADMHFWDATTFKWDTRNCLNIEKFEDLETKNEAMISRWNERVSPSDHVYIVGDMFSCSKEKAQEILKRLRGAKHFIIGNHDRAWLKDIAASRKYSVIECCDYKKVIDNGRKVILSHYPIAFWEAQHEGSFHIYGHLHASREHDAFTRFGTQMVEEGFVPEFRAFNVGAMLHGYAPVSLDELIDETEDVSHMSKRDFRGEGS